MKICEKYLIATCVCIAWLSIMPLNVWSAERSGGGRTSDESGTMRPDQGPYLVGPGDVIDVSIWKDEALTKSLVVLPDGKISFPLIGEMQASGRSLGDIKAEVEEKIKPFVPEPTVSVEIKQINSMLVYVIGRVNQPGRFIVNTNVNVLQALAMAGGLNPFAKRDKIRVLRKNGEKTITFPFRYDDVVEGARLEQNIVLVRGDVVVVP